MPLSIDMQRAARTHPELVGLVTAVRDAAPGEPETDSLEWKGCWDLGDVRMRFETARHVLGFGNRTVFAAAQQFEGCAYVLLGVEPGNLVGTAVVDPAEIDDQLSKYVSPGQPRWSPSYVRVDGKDVLVLTVEGPRDGDPIFALQRMYDRWPAGRIFVRRHGKTEEAGPTDIRALEARGQAARPKVELGVTRADDGVPLQAVRFTTADRDRWIASERSRLLAPLDPPPRTPGSLLGLMGVGAAAGYSRGFGGDSRSADEYRLEVETYLADAPRRWFAEVAQRGVASDLARIRLQIVNPTERNFEEVEVLVVLPDRQLAWMNADEAFRVLGAPTPPKTWGTYTIVDSIAIPRTPVLPGFPSKRDQIERHADRRLVRFAPCHVRPGETVALPPFHLTVRPEQGNEIVLRWRLTSTAADGWSEGELLYEVASKAVEIQLVPSDEARRDALRAALRRQETGDAPTETGQTPADPNGS